QKARPYHHFPHHLRVPAKAEAGIASPQSITQPLVYEQIGLSCWYAGHIHGGAEPQ
ncbi:unnamed protein product, partial [marine sediment metagenome]